MLEQAKYSYIEWLPENKIILATAQSMLSDKYITGLVGKNIYPYSRDDAGDFMLPAIFVDSGDIYSYDNLDRIEGEIVIKLFYGTNLVRTKTTEVIQSGMAVIRNRIQNYNFFESVVLNMVDYNSTLSKFQSTFDKESFSYALRNKQWLQRYGINYRARPATSESLNQNVTCYVNKITFNYWLMQQTYNEFLELIGINEQIDPNKIVYNRWETFTPNIQEI